MRVVIPALVGPRVPGIGGTAANVTELAAGLRRRGHDVHVLGCGPPDAATPEFTPLVHRADPRSRDLSLALWRRRRSWEFPGDVLVNVHRPDHALGFLAGQWPLVVNFRGVHRREIARGRGRVASWLYEKLTDRVMDRADALVFTSGYDQSEVTRDRGKWTAKSHRVTTGVDRDRFAVRDRAEARHRLGLPPHAFGIGFVGRFTPEKNISALVEAVRRAPGTEFWAAGSGPLAGRLEAGGGIRMVGHLGEDLPWFYAACDLIALASFYEGLPTVIPEAWASGRPVVAPRVTGLGELLADGGGVLAESPGSTDLARALGACRERLSAGDPEFSASALRERSEPYDWERVVDATVAVYEFAREHRCASS